MSVAPPLGETRVPVPPPLGEGRVGADAVSPRPRAGSTRGERSASAPAGAGADAEMARVVLRQPTALRHGPLAVAPLWRGRRARDPDLGRSPEIAVDVDYG